MKRIIQDEINKSIVTKDGQKFINNINFTKHKFNECDISHINFNDCNFSEADLSEINLEYCDFINCNMYSSNLEYSYGQLVSFQNCNMEDANLMHVDFNEVEFKNIDLSMTHMSSCRLNQLTLTNVVGDGKKIISKKVKGNDIYYCTETEDVTDYYEDDYKDTDMVYVNGDSFPEEIISIIKYMSEETFNLIKGL